MLLIEEPEAHLHPQLQELVHNFLSDTNEEDINIQIIFTSHCPTLASKVDVENINLIYENNHRKYCLPFAEANLTNANDDTFVGLADAESDAELISEHIKIHLNPIPDFILRFENIDDMKFVVPDGMGWIKHRVL